MGRTGVIRRFALNQPNGRIGQNPGWFRNTFSGEELQNLQANVLLWRRGRVYFADGEDQCPTCKSNDGLRPAAKIATPKNGCCGHWNNSGQFVPECQLAAWRFHDGRRLAPLCQETWSFLGVLEDDGLPFWLSLKGGSLRSARLFLSMCYEVIRDGERDLLDCSIRLSTRLVKGRNFEYYVVHFSDPRWRGAKEAKRQRLRHLLKNIGRTEIQSTFDAEASHTTPPAMAG